MLDKKQIFLLHWLYNFSINEMEGNPRAFLPSDKTKLMAAIYRRFPEHADEITKPFDVRGEKSE